MGRYPEGFAELETSDPEKIREVLSADCQVSRNGENREPGFFRALKDSAGSTVKGLRYTKRSTSIDAKDCTNVHTQVLVRFGSAR